MASVVITLRITHSEFKYTPKLHLKTIELCVVYKENINYS